MKRFLLIFSFLITFCLAAHSQATGLADLKFGRYQIADSQWNVSACMYTTTCQIYSKNPGTAYKIPWWSGQIQWATGDYIAFVNNANNDASNPWLAVQYGSNGVAKTNMGTGHIINMGTDFFFFVGNDNDTGQLFSMTSGFANTSGVTWTGTRNPTVAQVDAYATNGSTTPLAAGQTATPAGPPPPPSLCCGGSAAAFNANTINTAKVLTFTNRTTADSRVTIEQLGTQNEVVVDQSGTKQNYVNYYGNGLSNDIDIKQTGNSTTQVNYTDLRVVGNFNTVKIEQTSTGGGKGAFVNVQDNNNNLTLKQQDGGSHYAEVNLSGGNKTVDILQQGSAGHMASVILTGPQPSSLNLIQAGSTQQYYSITNNCTTAGGCAPITVTQGR
jgi:hypothetical protein